MNSAELTVDRILTFVLGARGKLPVVLFKRQLAEQDPALIVVEDSHEPTVRSTQRPCCLVTDARPGWVYAYHGNARYGVTLCAESLVELPSPHPEDFLDPVRRFVLPAFPDSLVEIDGSIARHPPVVRVMRRIAGAR